MKKVFNWQVILGLVLVLASTLVYFIHYWIFHDAHHIFIYLIGDIAFVFFEVLLVTLILHRLLESRSKQQLLKKMNMVIGAFFSEVGTRLVSLFAEYDLKRNELSRDLNISADWNKLKFKKEIKRLRKRELELDIKKGDLASLRSFLVERRAFLLRLLENPNLLEHESFTNLLWAVFHLTEELSHRDSLYKLPDSDLEHLAGDIKRTYRRLLVSWLQYIRHLKSDYPYLFSLAVRTNPFDKNATVVVSK